MSSGEKLKVRFGGGGTGGSGDICPGGKGGGRSELLGFSPLVVAGGGGGGGGVDVGTGGNGGNANALVGEKGLPATAGEFTGAGGEGGGASPGKGGAGGTISGCVPGFPGMLETGGEGGDLGSGNFCEGGGGGGGGHEGGGGGGSGEFAGGGGGAGSSFIASGATGSVASGAGEAQRVLITTLPTSIQQCMKNGWKNFGTKVKNQGQCIKFVETGR